MEDEPKFDTLDMHGFFKIIKVRKVKVKDDLDLAIFIDILKDKFQTHNQDSKNKINFKLVEDVQYPPEITKKKRYSSFAENIIIVEYSLEIIPEEKLYEKINGEYVKITEIIKDYIFIIYPDLIAFKGNKQNFSKVWKDFNVLLKDKVIVIKDYSFNVEFFMYLLEKAMFNKPLINDNFKIIFVEDLLFDGRENSVREILEAKDLIYIILSRYVIMKLLGNNKPIECIFYIILSDWKYSIKIDRIGKIEFFQNKTDFKKSSHNLRAFLGCYFIEHLISLYDFWINLNSMDKYISINFITNLKRHLKIEEGIDFSKEALDMINYYINKRKEE
jgi:hypothetical protein